MIVPRLEDVVEVRGYQGLNRWLHERDFAKSRVFRRSVYVGTWTVFASRLLTYPLNHIGNCVTASVIGTTPLIDIITKTRHHHFYPALGRTIPSNVLTLAVGETIKFYSDGQSIVRRGTDERQPLSSLFYKNFMAGAVAAGVVSPLFYSVESAQRATTIDMGHGSKRYFGVTHALEQRYVQMGARSFKDGMSVSLFGSMLYRGLQFGFYELGKANFLSVEDKKLSHLFPLALLASVTSGVLLVPIDALRMTYFKAQFRLYVSPEKPLYYLKLIPIKTLTGLVPVALFKSVGAALTLCMFDHFKKPVEKAPVQVYTVYEKLN